MLLASLLSLSFSSTPPAPISNVANYSIVQMSLLQQFQTLKNSESFLNMLAGPDVDPTIALGIKTLYQALQTAPNPVIPIHVPAARGIAGPVHATAEINSHDRTSATQYSSNSRRQYDYEAIRAAYNAGGFTQKQIANRFGCSQSTVSRAVNSKW